MKKILTLTILLVATLTLSAKKKANAEHSESAQTVYLYALSASFNDSIVYITDIQTVEGAYIEKKHILGGLRQYVQQMDRYFKEKGVADRINTVFFKTKRTKAEKQFVKLRKRYTKDGIDLRVLPQGEFSFQPVKKE